MGLLPHDLPCRLSVALPPAPLGPRRFISDIPDFMDRRFAGTDSLCIPRDALLVRADCWLDGAGLAERLLNAEVRFLTKRNPWDARHLSGTAPPARAREMGAEPERGAKRRGRSYCRFEIDDFPRGFEARGVRCIAEVRGDLWNDKGQRYLSEESGGVVPHAGRASETRIP